VQTVLVVEDEAFTRQLVCVALGTAGYEVTAVGSAAAALDALRTVKPDIAILDVGLPDMTGWQLCERLRADGDLPVLFLSAHARDIDIVRGLRVGADDYLVKPFSPAVLIARVEAVLRRATQRPVSRAVQLPGLTIDVGRATVERDRAQVALTASELRILAALSQEPGTVLDARQLALATQGYDLPRGEASRLIKVHISNLRQKLEPDPKRPSYILTVRGIGYRLNVATNGTNA
jgi:DNA-binding response OmpR family regulator